MPSLTDQPFDQLVPLAEVDEGPARQDRVAARVRLNPTEFESTRPAAFLSSGTIARPCAIASSVLLNRTFLPFSQIAPLSKLLAPNKRRHDLASSGADQTGEAEDFSLAD